MNEPSVDFIYPDDELEAKENAYREAGRQYCRIINQVVEYIIQSDNKHMAAWVVAYALGLPICEGRTMSEAAATIKIKEINKDGHAHIRSASVQALSKRIKQLQNSLDINTKAYTYEHRKNRNR